MSLLRQEQSQKGHKEDIRSCVTKLRLRLSHPWQWRKPCEPLVGGAVGPENTRSVANPAFPPPLIYCYFFHCVREINLSSTKDSLRNLVSDM